MSSGSKKKKPRYACLSKAKASHSQRMWAEVPSSAPHLLHSGLSNSPNRWRCLFRVLCPVRRPVTALDWVLLKERNLALAPRKGYEIRISILESLLCFLLTISGWKNWWFKNYYNFKRVRIFTTKQYFLSRGCIFLCPWITSCFTKSL